MLARYGGSWRGIKPKVAAEHGAIACIIYSDPHEDGYYQGDVYPGRSVPRLGHDSARQRDGHAALSRRSVHAGSSVEERASSGIPIDKIETFAPIPVQPMSYRDGIELLKRLKGPVAPEAWRGSLPIDVPHRSRSGEGPHEAADGLRAAAPDQRRRAESPARWRRTNGSSSARIATRGRSARRTRSAVTCR